MTHGKRSADYTIKGFLYQFNKTLLEVLKAQDDDVITVEGIVEDIELQSYSSVEAIQCKYHETLSSFKPSTIYKPLLQMVQHYHSGTSPNVSYILFAHFPNLDAAPTVDRETLTSALQSKDKRLDKYIKEVPKEADLDGFLHRFRLELGPSYDDLVTQVGDALVENGVPRNEVETLAYPNAIHKIATLSATHEERERKIAKKSFLRDLERIRSTTISQWTLALKTRKKILDAKRKQLKVHLDKNARHRCFVIDPDNVSDFQDQIVLFINDYIDKYHYKPAHINTPTLCICRGMDKVRDVQHRLFLKGIISEDGYIGGRFEEARFFREPLAEKRAGGKPRREFDLRILSWDDHGSVINSRKADDMFLIGGPDCKSIDTVDVNVERLEGAAIQEIMYIMGVSNVYE